MVIQMVPGQVGEHGDIKGQTADPALIQGMGGQLHDQMGRTRIDIAQNRIFLLIMLDQT